MGRVILHADMDAFYASVEQRDRPELRGKPVIIGAKSPRGVVSAASYEARKFGVHSAMPGFLAHKLCPGGVFLAGDMDKYVAVSRQVADVFAEFTDAIEPLSLDEAFLDITGSIGLFGSAEVIGRDLKRRVREAVDLPISVGIATSKLMAKMACGRGKPDGLLIIPPGQEAAVLAPLDVGELFGIGPKSAEKLRAAGFLTIGDLATAELARLIPLVGRRAGELQALARGVDQRPVVAQRQAKSIGEEATFEGDVLDAERIMSALSAHAHAVAARARRAGLLGQTVVVKAKLARRRHTGSSPLSPHEIFPVHSRQTKLKHPTCAAQDIRQVALSLWAEMQLHEPVRLLGVTLSDLTDQASASEQLDLFARPRAEGQSHRLGQAMDAIATKFGKRAVRFGADAPEKVTASDRAKLGELEPRAPSEKDAPNRRRPR
jgi:DNA polymerase IV